MRTTCKLIPFFLLFSFNLFGQTSVSGYVKNNKQEPLIGANVSIQNTIFGAACDVNGFYNIDILDVVLLVNFVLGADTPDNTQSMLSDLNDDGIINILDIIFLINVILGGE